MMRLKFVRKQICLILVICIVCSLLGRVSYSDIFNGEYITEVSAAKKSSGTKNMTADIKVKSKNGRKMKDKEVEALSASSFKLLSSVIDSEPENKNILISPASILYAFGMAENGAKGKTRSQLETVVNGGIKTGNLNKVLASTRKRMMGSKSVSWNVANSVWYRNRKDIKVRRTFLKKVKAYYGAEVYKAPFNSKTVKDINSWVKKNTRKMIPKIIDRTSKSDVMYLINAMAFEGEWAEKFTDGQIKKEQDFTNIDGTVSKVTMLSGSENLYFELNGAYGFKKSYMGGEYSFVGIDIPKGITPAEYVKWLSENGGAFADALNNMKRAKVKLQMPGFKTDYGVEMSNILKGFGATYAFDKNRANLYNMFEKTSDSNYYFSAVFHKTHIEVDKNGTKAAAVTSITIKNTTSVVSPDLESVEIILDHPFVYAIVDNTTKLPVFIGVQNSMQ